MPASDPSALGHKWGHQLKSDQVSPRIGEPRQRSSGRRSQVPAEHNAGQTPLWSPLKESGENLRDTSGGISSNTEPVAPHQTSVVVVPALQR